MVARTAGARWYRPLAFGLAVLVLAAGAVVARIVWQPFVAGADVGADLALFSELGRRFAEDGSMYAPWQMEPYPYNAGSGEDPRVMPSLYPPFVGPTFAVIRFLPPLLWWAIPLGILGGFLVTSRPAPWTWPLMALATLSPVTWGGIYSGGSTMWVVAFVALALRFGWPAALVLVKPTFAPLVLLGIRHRGTWVAVAAMLGVSVLLLPESVRYLEAMRNVQGASLLYSLGDLPFVLLPAIAYLGSARGSSWSERSARRILGAPSGRWSERGTAPESAAGAPGPQPLPRRGLATPRR